MVLRKTRVRITTRSLIATAAMLISSVAYADAIDGTWCSENGRTITIEGSTLTSGAKRVEGHYTRHSFTYSPPDLAGVPPLSLVLMNENTAQSRMASETGKPEIWRRCEQTS